MDLLHDAHEREPIGALHYFGQRIRLPLWVFVAAVGIFCGACSGPSTTSPGPVPGANGCSQTAGAVCFGRNNYIEYAVGALPIVISIPHGGTLAPSSIPDRIGTTVTDLNTIELGRAIAQAFSVRTGRAPHLVITLLRRTKLDTNRDLAEGAQGNAEAAQAWTEYHEFVGTAIAAARQRSGTGFYIDLHGHGHQAQRLELGYLLSSADLSRPDAELNAGAYAARSSLRLAAAMSDAPFAELLRGATSVGGLLAGKFPTVPSPGTLSPGGDPYFDGGYSTERHTTSLPGLQIEANFQGVRDSPSSRAAFATALVDAITAFLATHLRVTL